MKAFLRILAAFALLAATGADAHPAIAGAWGSSAASPDAPPAPMPIPPRVLGSANAPIKVDEFVALTCSHCAEFYNVTMPQIEKKYVETGKVRFVLHDFIMDASGLKAVVIARCMPEDSFYPFIKILFKNQMEWAGSPNAEKTLISYAKLGGLPEDKAQSCLKDTQFQDALIADMTASAQKYNVEATPTFVINDGAEIIKGSEPIETFTKLFDKLLADKH
ncbi:MAG: DsbA family protein [Pseudomonadota bacterium]|nr:DsbA family protein [Pseudomonadota bacterium]